MIAAILASGLLLAASEALDRMAHPRPAAWRARSLLGLPFRVAVTAALFGGFLVLTGRGLTAVLVTVLFLFTVSAGSNVKWRVLGEPLCFTDFALVREMVRHPGFYLGAIPPSRRILLGLVALAASVALAFGSTLAWQPRAVGLVVLGFSWAAPALLRSPFWRGFMGKPDLIGDITRHGLLATLLVYPVRLRLEPPLRPMREAAEDAMRMDGADAAAPPLLVVVQCESFADPVDLGPAVPFEPLPGLVAARSQAVRHGRLLVSGFGAYTMRTEYGVIFGREETELGFRRFDPFLSAGDVECGDALPRRFRRRFGRCRAAFAHPHPLSFYGRDHLMRRAGFDWLLGEADFADAPTDGPHVSDAALGDVLTHWIRKPADQQPDLLYAVTIENHGPWSPNRLFPARDGTQSWLHHVRHGDALLTRLVDALESLDRPAVLCFFGDHRPSIPGAVFPASDRDTPFVILRFPTGQAATVSPPECLTPAELHRAILEAANGASRPSCRNGGSAEGDRPHI